MYAVYTLHVLCNVSVKPRVRWLYQLQMCQTGTRLVLKGLHYEETHFAALKTFASVLKVICTSNKRSG